MPFQIIRNDITKVKADAIVNTANPRPVIGGGTDSEIYRAAGEEQLLAERRKIGNIERGQAASTPAFNLNAKYIIHTVGPRWIDGEQGERDTLRSCYANSLELAAGLGCESIAFPMISTGSYGFPKDEALDIALAEIGKFLLTHEMDITLVVFDKTSLQLSEKLVGEIDKYIDEHAVGILRDREYGYPRSYYSSRRRLLEDMKKSEERPLPRSKSENSLKSPKPREDREDSDLLYDLYISPIEALPDSAEPDLFETEFYDIELPCSAKTASGKMPRSFDEMKDGIKGIFAGPKEDTFQERLFKLIDERGLSDVTVYKRANVNRKVFSKIRCNVDYHPQKKTAVAFAIALELDMQEMKDLLARAEFALSPSSKFDLIISYFVNNKNYDIYEINTALFEYDQPLLGY